MLSNACGRNVLATDVQRRDRGEEMMIAEENDPDLDPAIDEVGLLKRVNEMNHVLGSDDAKLPTYMCGFHASMVKHQEETWTLLTYLNAKVKKLVDAAEDNEMALERTTVRLDGLEVYAVPML
jgi:hypothetical protein